MPDLFIPNLLDKGSLRFGVPDALLSAEGREQRRAIIEARNEHLLSLDDESETRAGLPSIELILNINDAAISPIWDGYVSVLRAGGHTALTSKLIDLGRHAVQAGKEYKNALAKIEAGTAAGFRSTPQYLDSARAQMELLVFQHDLLTAVLEEDRVFGAPGLWGPPPSDSTDASTDATEFVPVVVETRYWEQGNPRINYRSWLRLAEFAALALLRIPAEYRGRHSESKRFKDALAPLLASGMAADYIEEAALDQTGYTSRASQLREAGNAIIEARRL